MNLRIERLWNAARPRPDKRKRTLGSTVRGPAGRSSEEVEARADGTLVAAARHRRLRLRSGVPARWALAQSREMVTSIEK
jgi:hypothetical protein